MTDTGKHAIPPPPPRVHRKKPSPLPWKRHSEPCDFSDEPTEVRRVAEPVARAVREQLEQPWYVRLALAVAITLTAGAIAWAANALISGSTADAVHETEITGLRKDVDILRTDVGRVDGKVDQILLELRGRSRGP